MGRPVRVYTTIAGRHMTGIVVGHRWRTVGAYGGGVGSYPVFVVQYAPGVTEGGIPPTSIEEIASGWDPGDSDTLRYCLAMWNLIGLIGGINEAKRFDAGRVTA